MATIKATDSVLNVRLTRGERIALEKMADQERRSLSQQAAVSIREAALSRGLALEADRRDGDDDE
jgi:hypothetical protein